MGKARFTCNENPSAEEVRKRTEAFAESLGEGTVTRLLLRQTIATVETPIAHGGFKRWRTFNQEGDARIWQTRQPDSSFVYLKASAAVVTGIELF